MALGWTDAGEIGRLLAEGHSEVDPLAVRPPDLQRWVTELDGFDGPTRPPTALAVEEIQRAWHRATT